MLQASLLELVESGHLGTVTLKSTRATVHAALGDPDQSSTVTNEDGQPAMSRSRFWHLGNTRRNL
jgi:hypothetical protein